MSDRCQSSCVDWVLVVVCHRRTQAVSVWIVDTLTATGLHSTPLQSIPACIRKESECSRFQTEQTPINTMLLQTHKIKRQRPSHLQTPQPFHAQKPGRHYRRPLCNPGRWLDSLVLVLSPRPAGHPCLLSGNCRVRIASSAEACH